MKNVQNDHNVPNGPSALSVGVEAAFVGMIAEVEAAEGVEILTAAYHAEDPDLRRMYITSMAQIANR